MPTVTSISFNVKYDLTSVPTLVLTDTSTIPSGAVGKYAITLPDNYTRTGSYSAPDVSISGGAFSYVLRLDSTGNVQTGQYTIVYTIKTTDLLISTFTRTYQFYYVPVDLKLTEKFDVFTPVLGYTDDTNYQVSNFNTNSFTRNWTGISTPTGTLNGNSQSFSLAYSGFYYDANYLISLYSSIQYTHQTYSWLTVQEIISKTINTYAQTPATISQIVVLISGLKTKLDSLVNTIQLYTDTKEAFQYAESLFTHIIDKIRVNNTDSIYIDLQNLIVVLHNNQIPTYVPLNTIINAYDLTPLSALALGNLTSTDINVMGGTGSVIGAGTSLTLANVNSNTGTFGSSTAIPVVTVNGKGLVTEMSTTTVSIPSGAITFVGDVTGNGTTGSNTTLTLATVNSNVYGSNTFIKFAVNGKGVITSATAIVSSDITGVLGFTPENVANKSTSTSLGTSNTLYPTQNAVKTYIDSAVAGGIILQGDWNASTNSPNISSTTVAGWAWRVSVAGSTNLGGIIDWQIGDLVIKTATGWLKIGNTDSIISVFGRYGVITASIGDYNTSLVTENTNLYYTQARFDTAFSGKTTTNLTEGTNLYYTDERARASNSFVAGSGAYNSTTGVITIPTNNNQILNGAAYITLGSLSATSPVFYNSTTGVISSQAASETLNGYVTTGTQTIAGAKTFKSLLNVNNKIYLQTDLASTGVYFQSYNSNELSIGATSSGTVYYSSFILQYSTRYYTLPNADGTIALTSNLSSYVPYTGATANVNLGSNDLIAYAVKANILEASLNGSASSPLILRTGESGFASGLNAISLISSPASGNTLSIISDVSSVSKRANIYLGSLTTENTYTLPDATGTIALTSDLGSYLPLTGGTLTGILNISTASYLTSRLKLINTATGGNIWSLSSGNQNNSTNNSLFTIINETLSKNTFVLSPTGKLAIGADLGTTNPADDLGIFGTNTNIKLFDITGNGSNLYLQATNTEAYISAGYTTTAIPLIFQTGNTTRLTIAATGGATFAGNVNFSSTIGNGTYTYTLPSATGTLALTSNLSAYLPLSGGTLTGSFNGTSATFSGDVSLSGASGNRTLNIQTNTSGDAILNLIAAGSDSGAITYKRSTSEMIFSNSGATSALKIASSGAATFSSSVTAGGIITASFADANIKLKGATNNYLLQIVDANNRFRIFDNTNNAERFTITSGGNVGIGTTSPQQKLVVSNGGANGFEFNTTTGEFFTYNRSTSAFTPMNIFGSYITFNATAEAMRITSGGNVGIGTTNPQTLLSIENSGVQNTVSPIITSQSTGTTYAGMYSIRDGAGDQRGLIFQNFTANIGLTEKMRITSGGNVGIGTSSPTIGYKLDVKGLVRFGNDSNANILQMGDLDANSTYIQSVSTGGIAKNLVFYNTAETMRITSGGNVGIGANPSFGKLWAEQDSSWGLVVNTSSTTPSTIYLRNIGSADNGYINSNTALAFRTGDTERMRIRTDGSILFSTTSTLTTDNNTLTSYSSNGYLYLMGGSAGLALTANGNRNNAIYLSETDNNIRFYTNATGEKIRISSLGHLLINTTSDVSHMLQCNGAIISKGSLAILYVQARDLSVNYGLYADNNTYLNFYNDISGVTGQYTRSTGVYTAISDINKKKDFEQSTIGLNAILGLKPTLFRMKEDEDSSNKLLGFIAQEVKEFIPQAYVENDGFIGLQDRPFIAALVKGMQEQQAQIEELSNRLIKLESK